MRFFNALFAVFLLVFLLTGKAFARVDEGKACIWSTTTYQGEKRRLECTLEIAKEMGRNRIKLLESKGHTILTYQGNRLNNRFVDSSISSPRGGVSTKFLYYVIHYAEDRDFAPLSKEERALLREKITP